MSNFFFLVFYFIAARVIEAMNKSIQPCDDFYKFACGGWIARHPIPQSHTSWDQLSLLREDLLQSLRVLLEEPNQDNDLRPVKLARALYKTCMDTGKLYHLNYIFNYISHSHSSEKKENK